VLSSLFSTPRQSTTHFAKLLKIGDMPLISPFSLCEIRAHAVFLCVRSVVERRNEFSRVSSAEFPATFTRLCRVFTSPPDCTGEGAGDRHEAFADAELLSPTDTTTEVRL
jgi:hypothetical protein